MTAEPTPSLLARARRIAARFARGESGVAAVEFAGVIVFLLPAYLGTVEFAQGYILSRKVAVATRNLADMVSQEQAVIDNTRMVELFRAAKGAVSPYDGTKARMTVTSLQMVGTTPTVMWSDRFSGDNVRSPGYAAGAPPFAVPPGLLVAPGDSTIMAEVTYDYEPILHWVVKKTITLKGSASDTGAVYMRPRNIALIQRNQAS